MDSPSSGEVSSASGVSPSGTLISVDPGEPANEVAARRF